MGNKTGKGLEFKPENVHLNTATVALIDEDLLAVIAQVGKDIQKIFTKSNTANAQLEKRLDEKIGDLSVRIREWNAGKRAPDDYQFVKEGFHQLARVIATIGTKMDKAYNYRDSRGMKHPKLVMHNGDTPKKALNKVAQLAAIFSDMSSKFLDRPYSYKLHTKANGSGQYDANSYNKDFRMLVDMMSRSSNFNTFTDGKGNAYATLQKINALLGDNASSLLAKMKGEDGGVGSSGADYSEELGKIVNVLSNIDQNVFGIAKILGSKYGIYLHPHAPVPINKPRSQVSKRERKQYGDTRASIFPLPKNYHVNYARAGMEGPPGERIYINPFRKVEQRYFKRFEERRKETTNLIRRINIQIAKESEVLTNLIKTHAEMLAKIDATSKGKITDKARNIIKSKFKTDEEAQRQVVENLSEKRNETLEKASKTRKKSKDYYLKRRKQWEAELKGLIPNGVSKDELDESKEPGKRFRRNALDLYKSNKASRWGANIENVPTVESIMQSDKTPFEKKELLKERNALIKKNNHEFKLSRRIVLSHLLFGNSNWFANPKDKNMMQKDPWDPDSEWYNPFDGVNDRETAGMKQYAEFQKRQRVVAESAFSSMFSDASSPLGSSFNEGASVQDGSKSWKERLKDSLKEVLSNMYNDGHKYMSSITSPIKRTIGLAKWGIEDGNMPTLGSALQGITSSSKAGVWTNALGSILEQYGAVLESIPGNKKTIYESLNHKYDPDSLKGRALNRIYKFSGDNIDAGGMKGRVARGLGSMFSSTKGGLIGKIGGMFTKLALPVAGIFLILKKLVKSSPILQAVLDLLNLAVTLFFMPIGNTIGEKLLPAVLTLVNWAVEFNKLWTGTIVPILETVWHVVFFPFSLLINTFKEFLTGKTLGDAFKNALETALKPLRNTLDKISGWFSRRVDGFKSLFKGLPKMATGGIVSPMPGGTPVILGDGGEPEYVVPKSKMDQFINSNSTPNITIQFTGPVYGMNDFERQVETIVSRVTERGRFR